LQSTIDLDHSADGGVWSLTNYQFRCRVTNACASVDSDIATLTVCPSDFDCDGFASGSDFDLFVDAFEAGAGSADFDRDGFVSGVDFDLYVQAFEAGCG
jgi:hypothetical protein